MQTVKNERAAIIIGSGRLGTNLALHLNKCGYAVTIIDREDRAFRKLDASFSGFMTVGDAANPEVLEDAGVKKAAYVISVTEKDNTNILVGLIAKKIYNVENVFIRLSDTEKETLVEGTGIKTIFPFKLSMSDFKAQSGIQDTKDTGAIL